MYGCRGDSMRAPRLAASTMRPRNMTMTRSQSRATTARLWLMKRLASPRSSADPFEQADDLALHTDVEGADRLIADDEPRIDDERTRNDGSLQLASAQLVRITRRQVSPDADFVELRLRASCTLPGSGTWIERPQGFGDAFDERHARIEGGRGILEHALQLAPHADGRRAASTGRFAGRASALRRRQAARGAGSRVRALSCRSRIHRRDRAFHVRRS